MSKVFSKRPNVIARRIAGETILVPVSGNLADMRRLFSLNETAEVIWNLIETSVTIEAIAGRLVETFDISVDRAHEDAEVMLRELVSAGLADESE